MPTLASSVSSSSPGNDSPAMNRLTVKPMPPTAPSPATIAPAGVLRAAGRGRAVTASSDASRMPTGLPITRPATMPSATGDAERVAEHAASEVDAGVGEREDRQHDVRRHRVEPGLQPLDDRDRLVEQEPQPVQLVGVEVAVARAPPGRSRGRPPP